MYDPIIITLLLYFLVLCSSGYFVGRSLTHTSDYLLAGRSLSAPLVALGVGATDMSAWLMMSVPGLVFMHGMNQIWMPIALLVGAYCNWRFVAQRLRIYTHLLDDALTLPTFFYRRLGKQGEGLSVLMALINVLAFTGYVAAGFVGTALLVQSIMHVDYDVALALSVAVMLVYTLLGGFLALNRVDFFQGLWILICLWWVPWVVWQGLPDLQGSIDTIESVNSNFFTTWSQLPWWALASQLAWGIGYFGQPHILSRFMAIACPYSLNSARRIAIGWMGLAMLGAILVGAVGRLYFSEGNLDNPETIFLVLAKGWFSPWLTGLILASVLSAIMSTATAQLLSAASAAAEDCYLHFCSIQATQKGRLFYNRMAVIITGVAAALLAWSVEHAVLPLIERAWACLGATFGPVMLASLYWRHLTYRGALWGMITALMVIVLWLFGKHYHFSDVFELYELVPAFFSNSMVLYCVSRYTSTPDKGITKDFDGMLQQLK